MWWCCPKNPFVCTKLPVHSYFNGWDWKAKHPIRSGRGLDSYGWLIGWFLGVGELWFSGVCWLVNCGVVWCGWLTRKMRLGLF